ncbi:M48 family metalloprotease [Planotetraspora thailandica]|nr:M48 family metallopeptidase [Planotetraspora thailandica]
MTSPPTAPAGNLCPSCSSPVQEDPRFTSWCPACNWNVDLEPAEERHGRSARRHEARRTSDRAVVERLYAEVSDSTDARPRHDKEHLAAITIAGAVHLATLLLAAGSVWLLVAENPWVKFLGLVGLAVTFVVRPRFGRFKRDKWSLSRDEAPRLYDLADRVATEIGAPPIDLIRVTPEFNASYGRTSLSRRSILTIGLPLWELLEPQERVSILGHEFGHARNGDTRRGIWLHSAENALVRLLHITYPGRTSFHSDLTSVIADWVVSVMLFVPYKVTGLVLSLLRRFTLRAGQRAEYLADDLAARVGSSAASRSALATLVLGPSVELALQRMALAPQKGGPVRAGSRDAERQDLWEKLREFVASIPETERLRRFRASALHMTAVDESHPPTHLRVRLAAERPPVDGAIILAEPEITALETEMAPIRARVARAVLTSSF